MRIFASALVSLLLGIGVLCLVSACASLQTPNNPTTQALDEASAVTGAAASAIAAAAPAPWGQIVAAVLGALSVVAGIIAHSAAAKNNAQQVTSAVTNGLQAASQSLGISGTAAAK